MLPGDGALSLETLRLAIPGLAGLVGFCAIPTVGGWFRLALETLEANRASLGRPKRVSTISMARAIGATLCLGFFSFTWFRAASELRQIESEAAVVGPSMQGLLIGGAFWLIYGLGLAALGADLLRWRNERRLSSGLR